MGPKKRSTFGAEELAIGLSHYDLGIIYSIAEFPRGSHRAPKAIVECQNGKYLFKRRQRGVEEIQKVAFTHQIQLALAEQNFPLPHLLGTCDENNSMLVFNDHIYEVQEFIQGSGFDGSAKSTEQSGHALGLYHKLLENFQGDWEPPTASYHNAKTIFESIHKAADKLPKGSGEDPPIGETITVLANAYRKSAQEATDLGLKKWPRQIVHGDWHPGNMLFRKQMVAAVIDYDTARLHQRIIDVANGALQFSILGGGDDPRKWPRQLEVTRFQRFLRGYDSVNVITTDELRAIPFLMCEAMIAEAILPIAAAGKFHRFDGGVFLTMIRRKVEWILKHQEQLAGILDQADSDTVTAPPPPTRKKESSMNTDSLASGLTQVVDSPPPPSE
ncbi:MAG: phosphotransferase [Phycisphaerales bacterium]|jgi:Ser/Thr protein kinase RdoA (MazF antagonist)|nr:phosphotransferase [Phycisphaerales bacterium]MBT7171736.1 phosphotransferase [Phycisphaerales bacterium]